MSPITPTTAPSTVSKSARPLRWLVWCAPLVLAACSGPTAPQEQTGMAGQPADLGSMYDGVDRSWTDEDAGTKLTQEALLAGDNVLSKSPWAAATNGWGPLERNRSNGDAKSGDGKTLTLNGTTYATGLGVHANSSVTFNLSAACKLFTADIGIDDEVGTRGTVVFQVFGDGVKLYDSLKMTGASTTKKLRVDIQGRKVLKLVVTDAGDNNHYDHADWAAPTLQGCVLPAPPAMTTQPTPPPVVPAPAPVPTPPATPVVPTPPVVPAPPAPAPAPTVPVVSGPLVITKGGTYTGEFVSNDPSVAAIRIKTSEPVILENCTLRGRGHLIDASWTSAHLTVRNCKGYGLNPNDPTRVPGRFVQAQGIVSLLIENNLMEKTAGIYVNKWQGDKGLPVSIVIRNNLARDIEGRYSDGNGGFQDKFYRVQFVQFNGMRDLSGAEISWNRVENTARQSHVEDVINIYASNGVAGSPIRIHNNLINGAFSGRPDASYSGGGIMMGDGCGSGYTEAVNNTVLETSNYGIAVAGGHHQTIRGNTILAMGKLLDGTLLDAESDAGFYLRNYCQTPNDTSTVIAESNTVGWGVPSKSNANARWDWSATSGVERNNTRVQATNRAVDPQLLAQAVIDWERRAQAASMVIGPR